MSKLGSLYIQLGEPEGELAGCCETAEWAADYIESLRKQVEVLQHEVGAARQSKERTLRILMGIHALLHPPIFTDREGKMWQFKSPIIEEQMQALSDRIRAIPEEIDAISTTDDLDEFQSDVQAATGGLSQTPL